MPAGSGPRGRFITLEGGEGAGKSTQAARLAAALEASGRRVLLTREPGGTPAGEAVRALLLGVGDWDPLAEALLHFAARREHWVGRIRPALAAGDWVVCDRFADSTLAYQGFGAGLSAAAWEALVALTLEGAAPDLTCVLDVAPAVGLARVAARGSLNRYEAKAAAFHARVREGFLAIAAAAPERCVVIDGSAAEATVAAAVLAAVGDRLGAP